jgi:hypothetical protein
MKRCSKCVLPDTTPNISFDRTNICNYCHSYETFKYLGEEELLKILNSQKRVGSKYDFVMGISGGRDSSYALLKLVKDYKMKVLAVNYQNPFTDPQAELNIKNAVDVLNVDVKKFKLKRNIHEKTFKHNLEAWLKHPSPALIPMMCIACKTILPSIIKYAKKYNINCVITGGNPYEYTSFKQELLNVSRDQSYESTFIRSLLGIIQETIKNPSYYHPLCISTLIKGYLYGDPYALGPRIFASNIKFIDLFHYIPWEENQVISRIKSELNWDYPRKFKSNWRFDCKVGHLKDFLYMKTIKMTEKDDLFAKMVRENLITREEALLRLEKENEIYFDEIQQLLDKVGIKKSKLKSLT